MEIFHYADIDAAIGRLRVVSSSRGLVYVELPNASGRGLAGWMKTRAAGAKLLEGYAPNRAAATQLIEFSEGKRQRFDLSLDLRATEFQLAVYDQAGRRLRTLAVGPWAAGEHAVRWDGRDQRGRTVAAGAYLAVLDADGGRQVVKMSLIK